MGKFATALRLHWPWLEWKDASKIWIGSGNPWSKEDMEIFYAATTITLGNGRKTPFRHAPWLEGRKPIEIAPLIYALSKRKNWKVSQAMDEDAWVEKTDLGRPFTMEHFSQYVELWSLIANVHLDQETEDDITWRLTLNGEYSSKSAYELQFLG
jgi:hypothetical protein